MPRKTPFDLVVSCRSPPHFLLLAVASASTARSCKATQQPSSQVASTSWTPGSCPSSFLKPCRAHRLFLSPVRQHRRCGAHDRRSKIHRHYLTSTKFVLPSQSPVICGSFEPASTVPTRQSWPWSSFFPSGDHSAAARLIIMDRPLRILSAPHFFQFILLVSP
jgi:hypothetical protein